MPEISTPIMTVPEAAAYMRVSRATLYRLMASGDLLSIQHPHMRRLRRSDIDDYLDSLVVGSRAVVTAKRIGRPRKP